MGKGERGGRGTREGARLARPGRREGVPGGGAQAGALVPGVGEGGCWSGEQNGRASGRAGAAAGGLAAGLVRAAGSAQRSVQVASSCRDPFSLPERLTVWEGTPADTACIHAAGAPVTGVARPQEGRGLRDRDVSAGGAPGRRGSGDWGAAAQPFWLVL